MQDFISTAFLHDCHVIYHDSVINFNPATDQLVVSHYQFIVEQTGYENTEIRQPRYCLDVPGNYQSKRSTGMGENQK